MNIDPINTQLVKIELQVSEWHDLASVLCIYSKEKGKSSWGKYFDNMYMKIYNQLDKAEDDCAIPN